MSVRRLWRADHPDVHGFAVSTLTFAHRANEADLVSAASADRHLAGASRVARVGAGWQGGKPCSYPVMGQARGAFTLPGGWRWPSGLPRRMRETGSWPRLAVQERQPRRVLYQGMPRAPAARTMCTTCPVGTAVVGRRRSTGCGSRDAPGLRSPGAARLRCPGEQNGACRWSRPVRKFSGAPIRAVRMSRGRGRRGQQGLRAAGPGGRGAASGADLVRVVLGAGPAGGGWLTRGIRVSQGSHFGAAAGGPGLRRGRRVLRQRRPRHGRPRRGWLMRWRRRLPPSRRR